MKPEFDKFTAGLACRTQVIGMAHSHSNREINAET